jgi:Redoxin
MLDERNSRTQSLPVRPALLCLAMALSLVAGAAPERITLKAIPGPDGRPVEMGAPEKGATAVVFYSTECPISNAYSPELIRLAGGFPKGRVRFVGVCVDPDISDADVLAHAKDFGLTFPVLIDRAGDLGRRLGATVSPEAFVIDPDGRVRYHGRIDDQFAGRRKPNANTEAHELRDAVNAVLAGREVAAPHVPAVGCPIPEQAKPEASKGKAGVAK